MQRSSGRMQCAWYILEDRRRLCNYSPENEESEVGVRRALRAVCRVEVIILETQKPVKSYILGNDMILYMKRIS